ncbi:MAG: zinc ribbon domain-containing protein, partial [Armatimonadetes bacterium]|nr:zinc ribbon domain-containing protein [Armatimonadota bacterium]
MQCPECGHANVAGSLFCEKCGSDLQQVEAPREPYELQQHEVTWGEIDPFLDRNAALAF